MYAINYYGPEKAKKCVFELKDKRDSVKFFEGEI